MHPQLIQKPKIILLIKKKHDENHHVNNSYFSFFKFMDLLNSRSYVFIIIVKTKWRIPLFGTF